MKSGTRLGAIETVIFGSEPSPLLVVSDMTIDRETSDAELHHMAGTIAAGMEPIGNHQGRPETKRHQAATLLQRAFADLRGEFRDG
jgi:hypothetical protein